jgi:uncharacterized protein|tara:strand:- start:5275 stop:6264 length:990 start_codon:yes stop_codon:yes gene_type:complete
MDKRILILFDHRPGNNNQSIALAEEIGLKYKIANIEYNHLAKLPNILLKKSLNIITKNSKDNLYHILDNFNPDIVISCGRRLAIIAVTIKKILKIKPIMIQIMNPMMNFKNFDHIILPYHDKLPKYKKFNNNIIYINGALNKINNKNLNIAVSKFKNDFNNIKKNKLALIIGGKTRDFDIDNSTIKKLVNFINEIANNNNYYIFILNSRRTSPQISKFIKNNISCDYKFFDYNHVKENNPYLAILAYSDFLIVSPDSISMISECCSTNKPTYVFKCKKNTSQKHQNFVKYMIERNFLMELNLDQNYLNGFTPKIFQETKRIALIIKNLI